MARKRQLPIRIKVDVTRCDTARRRVCKECSYLRSRRIRNSRAVQRRENKKGRLKGESLIDPFHAQYDHSEINNSAYSVSRTAWPQTLRDSSKIHGRCLNSAS